MPPFGSAGRDAFRDFARGHAVRVVFDGRYIHDHFPGIGRYTYQLALGLAECLGDELRVLVDPVHFSTRFRQDALIAALGPRAVLVEADAGRGIGLLRVSGWLHRAVCDLYHSPFYVVPPALRPPLALTVFDVISDKLPRFMPGRIARLAYRLAMARALHLARGIAVPSDQTRRDLIEAHGLEGRRMTVIPLGCDGRFRPVARGAIDEARERLALPERFVLHLGINKPHKNVARLVEAYARIRHEIPQTLVLAGREDRRHPTGRALADRWGLDDRARVLGDVPEDLLPALYGAADLFVFPSLAEGFGLPPLEAMACGTPVICSRAGALPEVVGDAGLLVDPHSVGEIAAAMLRLASDRSLRDSFARAGLSRAARFTWQRAASETVSWYHHLTV